MAPASWASGDGLKAKFFPVHLSLSLSLSAVTSRTCYDAFAVDVHRLGNPRRGTSDELASTDALENGEQQHVAHRLRRHQPLAARLHEKMKCQVRIPCRWWERVSEKQQRAR
jgi:hypothetical protein